MNKQTLEMRRSVTTWTGVVLGTLTSAKEWRRWNVSGRNNGCTIMRSIRFLGTNGAEYHGRYGADWSTACRVRKVKERK